MTLKCLVIIRMLMFLSKSTYCRSLEGSNERYEVDSGDLQKVEIVINKIPKKCPENFVLLNDQCYFIPDEELDWHEANVKCEGLGAELAQIKSEKEINAIDLHLANIGLSSYEWIWIAGIHSDSDGEFHWTPSGDTISFSKWGLGEPTTTFDENCLRLKKDSGVLLMSDFDCTDESTFICKSRPIGKKTTKICPEKFTLVGNKCFFVEENTLLDQFEAKISCQSMGGELTKIRNNAEMKILNNYLTKFESGWIWIAGTDLRSEDNYYWDSIDDKMTYLNWGPGQPDKTNQNEHCMDLIFLIDEYYMNDANCLRKLAYVCESTPKDPNGLNGLTTKITTKRVKPSVADDECPIGFSKVGNKCYFVQNEQKSNWYNADRNCKKLKSDLVTIESADEMDLLAQHLQDAEGASTAWSWALNHYWTAANDLGSEGEFHWQSNGEAVSYSKWYPHEPNNANQEEHCANLRYFDDGYYMNDEKCENEMFYVCETKLLQPDLHRSDSELRVAPSSELDVNTCSELELFKINLLSQTKAVNMMYSKLSCNNTLE